MKFRIVAAAVLLALSGSVFSAQAADGTNGDGKSGNPESTLGRFGPYVSIAGAYDWRNTATGDETGGINSRLGLRVWKYLAVEFEYEWQGADPSAYTVGGNLKAMPFTVGTIQPFLLLGGVYWDLDHGPSDVGVRFGGGVDAYLTDHIYLTAGLEHIWGMESIQEANVTTLYGGVGFRL